MHCRNSMQAKKAKMKVPQIDASLCILGHWTIFAVIKGLRGAKQVRNCYWEGSQIQRLSSLVTWLCYIRP